MGFNLSVAPPDLMTKFVECLVRLPNLKTLEILGARPQALISKALECENAVSPSIRELRIGSANHHFIKNCPNLENLILTSLDLVALSTILWHGGGLKRAAGVPIDHYRGMSGEVFNA